ncbi:hemerythrin domain-containing protein [Streptomyces sp. NPDC102381]|uniref:hemerythrin domain-containing protein n=1 Tax=Streptomyces sp. NPDC102381 TaxID=3366164 RepID=UPI0038270CF8
MTHGRQDNAAQDPGAARPAKGIGDELVEVHDLFRERMAAIREEIAAVTSGAASPDIAAMSDAVAGMSLKEHCLTMCEALHGHHTREDGGLFRAVETGAPHLAGAVARLRREHVVVDESLHKIRALFDTVGLADPERLQRELEQLFNSLEEHFQYEEQQVVGPLNSLTRGAPAH